MPRKRAHTTAAAADAAAPADAPGNHGAEAASTYIQPVQRSGVLAGVPYWAGELPRQTPGAFDATAGCYTFPDYPEFRPNMSPEAVLRAGSFGGTYFRGIASSVAKRSFPPTVHLELPPRWFMGWTWRRWLRVRTMRPGSTDME